ncbi:expressed unknown protein [Seminavis robusta]|uniref:Uncharacterized protein n=1 Tax=Seminavis robusta TaxID=568900 RepID=A0A9N8E507_9STRA|nr:expressed unknown protein [Seminavis robusta]|eukprot:Sro625_g177470.1 n/a (129) ;mRNA; r:5253-5738
MTAFQVLCSSISNTETTRAICHAPTSNDTLESFHLGFEDVGHDAAKQVLEKNAYLRNFGGWAPHSLPLEVLDTFDFYLSDLNIFGERALLLENPENHTLWVEALVKSSWSSQVGMLLHCFTFYQKIQP